MCLAASIRILGIDAASETVARDSVNELEGLLPLRVGIDIDAQDRPKQLFRHDIMARIGRAVNDRVHAVALFLRGLATRNELQL